MSLLNKTPARGDMYYNFYKINDFRQVSGQIHFNGRIACISAFFRT